MILSITFSKPSKNSEIKKLLEKDYIKIRIQKNPDSALKSKITYSAEFFTQKQAFQKTLTQKEAEDFYKLHAGKTFKNTICKTETEEITTLSNRRGEIKTITKKISEQNSAMQNSKSLFNKKKNYILKEGIPVPFLVKLGVMTKEGKVIAQKYDKYRQINRFLEFIDDIIDDVTKVCTGQTGFTKERPLRIADFGCGKSYLTFAVYYFLKELKNIPVEITGLDLKEDVIKECSLLAKEFSYEGLNFYVGDVAEFSYKNPPDIMITLHACDTATDYALNYAVKHNTKAILSVPCCQHEINLQLEKTEKNDSSPFESLKRWGILKERFAALATDAIRAELLEQSGYNVQLLEFIDLSHTPKNILIRAVKKQSDITEKSLEKSITRTNALLCELKTEQTLVKLLKEPNRL